MRRLKYYTLPVKSTSSDAFTPSARATIPLLRRASMSDAASTRREFVKVAGSAAIGASLFPADAFAQPTAKRRYAIVGTGDRGSGMWGRDLVRRYPDLLEFVGLCDLNPKRAAAARAFIGVSSCPIFT